MTFLCNFVRRRLRTLLRTFSREDPDLQVKLGFTDTLLTLRNFRFDVPQLNQLLDGSSFSFEGFTVDYLVIRFSVWSAPAIQIEIRGVHVKLTARGTEEGSSGRVQASRETVANEIKKVMSSIDPEGCFLHEILERMMDGTSQRSKLKTSFSNLALRHFRIQIHGINVQVCFPGLSDLGCVLEINELRSDSEDSGNLGLLRSSATAVLFPLSRSSLTLSGHGFKIGYKRSNDDTHELCAFDSLVVLITLHNLQFTDLIVRVPELSFSFRPTDIPVLMGLSKLSSKASNSVRSGRYLWKVAARRSGLMISPHTSSFQNLVSAVILWIRYVNAYEYLLSLAGYSRKMPEKSSLWKVSENKRQFVTARRKWDMICDIEKELPAEAIARARRVARYRTCLNSQNANDDYEETSLYGHFSFLCQITWGLAYIWRLISRAFWSIACFLSFKKLSTQELQTDGNNEDDSERVSLEFHAVVNLGRLSITFYPEKMISGSMSSKDSAEHLDSNVVILCLSVDEFLVMHTADCLNQWSSASCGKLKIESSSFIKTSRFMRSTKDPSTSTERNKKHMREDVKTILEMDPAQPILLSKTVNNHGNDRQEGILHLQNLLREMWSNWNIKCLKLDRSTFKVSDNPCVLVDTKSCMAYEDAGNQDFGIWKCGMLLGKFDIVLDYSSLFSMALLIWQTQQCQSLVVDGITGGVHSSSLVTGGVNPEMASSDEYGIYRRIIELSLHKVHPERKIQVGIIVGGPQVKLLVEKAEEVDCLTGQKDLLLFDIHDLEFVVWPTSKSDLMPLRMFQGPDSTRSDRPSLHELGLTDTMIPSSGKYVSQGRNYLSSHLGFSGFDCSFCKMAEKKWRQFFVLRPVTICFSSLREHVYSFSEAIIDFSTGLDVLVLGLTIVSKTDDLSAYFQMLLSLVSGLSRGLSGSSSAGHSLGQGVLRSDAVHVEHEIEKTFCKTLFAVKASIKVRALDVIFDVPVTEKFEKPTELADSRIWSSVQEACAELSCEEQGFLVNLDFCELQSTLFRYRDNIWKSSGNFIIESSPVRSHDILFEACLSSCILSVCMNFSSRSARGVACRMADGSPGNAPTENEPTTNRVQAQREVDQLDSASDSALSNSTRWIHIDLALTNLLVARCSTKHVLVEIRRSSNFVTSVSIGRNFELVFCRVKGGLFVLEPEALIGLIHGFSAYLHFISSKMSVIQSSALDFEEVKADTGVSEVNIPSQQANRYLVEAFSIDVIQFALGFVCVDEYGGIREIVLEITLHSSLDSAGSEQKFLCEVSRLSVLSKILESVERDINITQFSSPAFSESSFISGAPLETSFQQRDVISSGDSTSVSGDFNGLRESSMNRNLEEEFHSRYKNYILEDLRVSASVKKQEITGHQFSQAWEGGCSVLGFDITISLSELQMVLSMLSSFSALPGGENTPASLERPSFNSEPERSFESVVPDGAIVAIQDIHQHMFFTVEDRGDKCVVAGTLHYSLVGERALFRVTYHRHQGWNSSVLWFSLTSLYAKNSKGEPLRLNYHSRSDIVNVSGLYDNAPTLFQASVGESQNYKGDIDWETYRKLVKDSFYLVNKKGDSGVAFVDGVPEFVRKPGNPFKFKVFRESLATRNITSVVPPEINDSETQSVMNSSPPSITVTVDAVSLTIVHELSETRDRFPLFRGSINMSQLTLQILSCKVRIMSTSNVLVLYFDAQTNQWREFIHPVEVSAFYRSTFQTQDLENTIHKVPSHVYCRIGKLEVFVTELSLDMLLFMLGKLEVAGPFSVKTSVILSNCCKIENLSGLDLTCRFNEKQTVTVGRKQTASIFLRHSMNHQSETPPVAAVQLSSGNFVTSSINVSLLEARTLAWRTRIVSLQDSRSHPGPFIVVDVKKGFEDGLSISVSPLTRIHNETSLPMEIRFQRSKQKKDVFASVPLKPGGSIDDSVAAFNAISLSGDLKKALTSLAVGNFSLSFRPKSLEKVSESEKSLASEWSEELEGGKAVRLTGIFDKLSYGVKRALAIKSVNVSLTTTHCSVTSENQSVDKVHFLIHSIGREVSIIRPDASSDVFERRNACIALREQKEIFLLPTVQVSNFLSSEAAIFLTETDQLTSMEKHSIGKHATVQSGKTMDFYANPDMIYFRVTLTATQTSCKPVNSGQWVKKLQKQKNDAESLDVGLDFAGGKYSASLRLSLGKRGVLEAAVFTPYILKNDSDCTLFFYPPDQKPLSGEDLEKLDHIVPPEFGLYLPKKTEGSWFVRSRKLKVILADGHGATEAVLDLDALSGLTEISLGTKDDSGVRYITRFGLSVKSISSKMFVPSRIVTFVPRHLVINESEEAINIRQRYFQEDSVGIITIKSKQRAALRLQEETTLRKERHLFENFIRKHGSDNANPLTFIQFRLNKANWSWSGPLCITSIGCFFLKFRRQSAETGRGAIEFATVNVTEEGSTLAVRFQKPPNTPPPYRIENFLSASLTYYQKDSSEIEVLGPGNGADYAWDDMTLPHKLVVIVDGMIPLREVSLDKVRPWKPLFKATQHRSIASHLMLEKKAKDHKTAYVDLGGFIEMAWSSETVPYCGWNERHVWNAKGKVEARYYLERKDGGVDLAVVGRVKSSSKRMSFRYALKENHSVLKKLGSVEDVKGWLDSIVSGEMPHVADVPATTMTEQAAGGFNIRTSMSGKYQKPIHPTIDFSWMGSSWTCRKRRRHYPSFSRNGVKVSVNDFVYVLAEQNKRLVAYLEDLYEDSKGNKMVVVRWFHKTDEVGVVLSDETVDREIFFSRCLQDIKIECIDGLATVLSPEHYDKFLKLPMSVQLPPFFCQKIYGDDGLKPYDITQLQGYWRQEMLRYLNVSNFKSGEGAQALGTDSATGASLVGCVGIRSKRRRSADGITDDCKASPDSVDVEASEASMCKEEKDGYYLKKGSLVEVLSQDSGIRGCWLKALIVKKHKDKVKVQYQDITDADDESKKLEEWILASRVADCDQLGLRTAGRKIVRPVLKPSNENNVWVVGVGMPVDVWWCDGWWEGIVVDKVSEEKFEVYLPGEKKMSSFHRSDLRQSMEWSSDEWVHMNSRSDIVSSVLSLMKEKEVEVKHDEKPSEVGDGVKISPKGEAKTTVSLPAATSSKPSTKKPVPDLLKDVLVSALNWEPSKKRKRTASYCKHKPSPTEGLSRERSLDCKRCSSMGDSLFSSSVVGRRKRNRIVSCCPHKPSLTDGFSCEKPLDCENGKFMGDSVFGSSVGQPLTGLVMSR